MQEKSERRSQEERSAAMRDRLVAAARDAFVARGYADAGTPEIVAAAGVTRGALYHHFTDKTDLFRAVAEAEARAVADEVAAVPDGPEALARGADAWFAAMARPGRVRILLRDGPAVLGAGEMARIDRRSGGETLRQGLAAVPGTGDGPELAALADVLSAGFDRAALRIDEGADPAPYRTALTLLFDRLAAGAGS